MFRFIKSLEGRDSGLIHKEARKEAKRQVTEMTKWLKFQRETNEEAIGIGGSFEPLVPIIEKAEKYQNKIYNETKKIKPLEEKLSLAIAHGEAEKVVESRDKLAEIESGQWALCWKILKIYCHISTLDGVVLTQVDTPDYIYKQREYEYEEKI